MPKSSLSNFSKTRGIRFEILITQQQNKSGFSKKVVETIVKRHVFSFLNQTRALLDEYAKQTGHALECVGISFEGKPCEDQNSVLSVQFSCTPEKIMEELNISIPVILVLREVAV